MIVWFGWFIQAHDSLNKGVETKPTDWIYGELWTKCHFNFNLYDLIYCLYSPNSFNISSLHTDEYRYTWPRSQDLPIVSHNNADFNLKN